MSCPEGIKILMKKQKKSHEEICMDLKNECCQTCQSNYVSVKFIKQFKVKIKSYQIEEQNLNIDLFDYDEIFDIESKKALKSGK
jgi:hypothetical protein